MPTHHSKIHKDLYYQVFIMYGAAYSPILNPIEEFFAYLKYYLRFAPKENRSKLIDGVNKAC